MPGPVPPNSAGGQAAHHFCTSETDLLDAAQKFWETYYNSIRALHTSLGRALTEPIKDRNLGTTSARHVSEFEKFWGDQLATAIDAPRSQVGKRKVQLAAHRSKSFDVCWPLQGEAKILISVKSMQNAYRNLTNRIEEACGDSAVLRLYRCNAVFGFFFVLDGKVARGKSEQGAALKSGNGSQKSKGVAPFLDLVEEGGDFFDLADVARYKRPPKPPPKKPSTKQKPPATKQDAINVTQMIHLDLASEGATEKAHFLYDAIAYVPTKVTNVGAGPGVPAWHLSFSQVDPRLEYGRLIARVREVAALRGFLPSTGSP
jgi:hypothetical protein